MGSAAEAEIGACYLNGQDGVPIRTTLTEMGHPQPPTPIQVDNTTAQSFAAGTMKQKRSKSIDMNFYWLQDRESQLHFHFYWGPGTSNLADYHSKHHSPAHHRRMRPTYIYTQQQAPTYLAACLLRGRAKPRHIPRGHQRTLTPLGVTQYRKHITKYAQLTTRAKGEWLNHSPPPKTLIS